MPQLGIKPERRYLSVNAGGAVAFDLLATQTTTSLSASIINICKYQI